MAPDRKRKGVTASTDAAGNGATQQASGVRVKREPLPENNAATSVKTEEFDRSSRRQSARIKSEPGIDSAQPGLAGGGHASKVAVEIEAKVKLEQWTATAEEASVKQEEQQKVTKSPGKKQKLPQPLGPFPDMGRPLPEECRVRHSTHASHGMTFLASKAPFKSEHRVQMHDCGCRKRLIRSCSHNEWISGKLPLTLGRIHM